MFQSVISQFLRLEDFRTSNKAYKIDELRIQIGSNRSRRLV